MNQVTDRVLVFAFGCVVGFVIGYIVKSIHCIRREVEEIKEHTHQPPPKDAGLARHPLVLDVVLLLVVLIVAYSAVQSQLASNKVTDQQHQTNTIVACNQQFLSETVAALNERTTYSTAQTNKNVELVKNQFLFLSQISVRPPPTKRDRLNSFHAYLNALSEFLVISKQTKEKAILNPFPTIPELKRCLTSKD